MNKAEMAKQICQELGISWNENLTTATLRGKPINSNDVYSSFLSNVEFKVPVQTLTQNYSISVQKSCLAA